MSEAFRKVRDLYYRGASGMGVATSQFWLRTAAPLPSWHEMKTNSLGAWMMVRIFRRPRCLRLRQVLPGGIPLMSTSRAVRQHGRLA